MATEASSFAFFDRHGKPQERFAKMTDAVRGAQDALGKVSGAKPASRAKTLGPAREALQKLRLGANWRDRSKRKVGASHLVSSDRIRIRDWTGRDWPTPSTTREGEGPDAGPWPYIDLNSLGNYFDWAVHAPGNPRFTDHECYCDLDTKRMGGYIKGVCDAPGNQEVMIGHVEGGFWFSHTPSRDCNLVLGGLAIQTYARQFRDLTDEGAFWAPQISNARVYQDNVLTVGYFSDGPGSQVYGRRMEPVGPGSSYTGDGDHSNESWGGWGPDEGGAAIGFADVDELVRNGERTLEFSYRPTVGVKKGETVDIFIGARSIIDAGLDDVKATIRQGGSWHLRRLGLWEV